MEVIDEHAMDACSKSHFRGLRLIGMNARNGHKLAAVDRQRTAVVGSQYERVFARVLKMKKAFEPHSEIRLARGDLQIETARQSHLLGGDFTKGGHVLPIAFEIGETDVRFDLHIAEEIAGDIPRFLVGEIQVGHAARRSHVERVAQESGQTGDGVLFRKVAQRKGTDVPRRSPSPRTGS